MRKSGSPQSPGNQLGVAEMFTVGIGPSSSHTVGPMRAGRDFASLLDRLCLAPVRIRVTLFGSLAATGIGHGTNRAVLLGLAGERPETVDVAAVDAIIPEVVRSGRLPLPGGKHVPFDLSADLLFQARLRPEFHVNALSIDAWVDARGARTGGGPALSRTYYSTGGGFVAVQEGEADPVPLEEESEAEARHVLYPFRSGEDLLERCASCGGSIAQVVRANEGRGRANADVDTRLDLILDTMFEVVARGARTEGVLPGGLGVPRRAAALRRRLSVDGGDPLLLMDWVTLYGLAVNEENAAGHRVVTAPTNGAAGIIPAVLGYFLVYRASQEVGGLERLNARFDLSDLGSLLSTFPRFRPLLRDFLLAATAVGSIIKVRASIAGAEVGCQGEVGSASAMAAAGLAQALGGTPAQVENAAEIAMEHSLGLTCDPVGGLVQIPCIERNAIGAVKSISAARMALYGDGRHQVSLDVAIETMRQTGADMLDKYKETSIGGLAVNVVEC